ncbi:MAG TPA: CCA tRNA nucleotidyltransferase [Symbiobacteriaceae bacterium]
MLSRRLELALSRLVLSRRLRRAVPPAVPAILRRLSESGYGAVLVGGCVRDLLLGRVPKDWDLAAEASCEAILSVFPAGRVMGVARGTQTVLLVRDHVPYEVTPFRGATLAEDLARRDFTVNAMALDPDGKLIDPLGGRRDLARGLLRGCGDPRERLDEDPLRMLRAVRLAAQLNFALDPDLVRAMAAMAPRLAGVAPERIGMEFGRLLVTDRPAWGLERLRELGLLARFAPELLEGVGVEQNQYHAFTVWEHTLLALALVPPELHLRLAALLHDVAKPRCLSVDSLGNRHFYRHELVGADVADALLERLRFDGESRKKAVHLVRYHMDLFGDGSMGDAAVRRMIRRVGREHMPDLLELRRADRLASGTRKGDLSPETVALLAQVERVLKADAALRVADLSVDGDDVVRAFGRPPGPYVGEVLQQLLEEVTQEPALNDRLTLLARLAELADLW